MRRWSLDLDRCTSQIQTPVFEAETRKAKCPGFSFFLPLELTFTLAVNETKQWCVIRVNVFIQGFYRKLISWGMQSCAKLIGGSWHSCREAVASEYVFMFTDYSVSAARVSNQTVHNMDYFSRSNTEKKLGCGLAHWKPAKVTLKLVIQTLTGLDVSTSKSAFGQNFAVFLTSVVVREKQMHII